MRRIILPQAVRVMIPPYLSNTVLVTGAGAEILTPETPQSLLVRG